MCMYNIHYYLYLSYIFYCWYKVTFFFFSDESPPFIVRATLTKYLDHIGVSKNITLKCFAVVCDKKSLESPVYAAFKEWIDLLKGTIK